MIGHLPIIKMRLRGIVPSVVWLNDYMNQTSRDWHETRTKTGKPIRALFPSVSIEPSDAIRSLDLRFLFGVEVRASSPDEKRAKALFEACKSVGASVVIGCHTQDEKHYTEQTGWLEIWRKDGIPE
jgi:hypothetical protein